MTIKSQSGTPKEKEYATRLLPVIKNHHLLLVTLMLWNATATEALPIFLDGLVDEYIAIIISVTLVLLFGEIIPASILTGPNQLQITASLTPLVYIVYVLFFPISYPLSLLLDYIIGHEGGLTVYSKLELATMMSIQAEESMRRASASGASREGIHHDEIAIIGGALKFRDMKAEDVMTPKDKIFQLSASDTLSYKVCCLDDKFFFSDTFSHI
jgi:metal transporter CNNM